MSHHRPTKVTWRWRFLRPCLNSLFAGLGMLLPLTFLTPTTAAAATGWTDSSGCSVPNGFYLAITTDRQTRLFAMLMTAQAGGRNVQIYVTGNCHTWGFAELDGVVIQ